MRTPGTRDCGGCRYWSEMLAMVQDGALTAMCLGTGPHGSRYTNETTTCEAFAKNTAGAVDEPPAYGEESRAEYQRQSEMRHPNGAPKYAPDGTMLDDKGNRSVFDDVDL